MVDVGNVSVDAKQLAQGAKLVRVAAALGPTPVGLVTAVVGGWKIGSAISPKVKKRKPLNKKVGAAKRETKLVATAKQVKAKTDSRT